MVSKCIAFVAATVLSAAAVPAHAGTPFLYAKTGVEFSPTLADQEACAKEASNIRAPFNGSAIGAAAASGGLAGAAAVGLLSGIMQGVHEAHLRADATDACMRSKGYAKLALTEAEAQSLQQAGSVEAKKAWAEKFLAGDIAARVEAALKPAVPPLPTLAAEPFAVGGAKLDPAKLTVASAPVSKKGVLLSGKIAHRRTAKVKSEFEVKGLPRYAVAKDATFYAVEYRPQTSASQDPSSAWCGPTLMRGLLAGGVNTACFVSTFDGYHLLTSDEYAPYSGLHSWMSGPPSSGQASILLKQSTLELEPSESDLMGDMDFELRLDRLGKTQISLEAAALRDGKSVTFWHGEVPIDANGQAILPFWSHRLLLQRTGDTVTARFMPDGDGRGWLDPKDSAAVTVSANPAPPPAATVAANSTSAS